MTAYYNEIDPYCAEWLSNLMEANVIAPGEIDTRSISDSERMQQRFLLNKSPN